MLTVNFEGLPEELILHIFKMLNKYTLTKCAFVCKQWRRIAYDESLWKCLNIPYRHMNIMTLDHLLRRNIKLLSISYAKVSYLFYIFNLIFTIMTKFQIYIDTEYSFETPLTTLQYLDMSDVFVTVESNNNNNNNNSKHKIQYNNFIFIFRFEFVIKSMLQFSKIKFGEL